MMKLFLWMSLLAMISCQSDNQQLELADCTCMGDENPVCGSDGQTYPNSCRARCSGVSEFTQGVCTGN